MMNDIFIFRHSDRLDKSKDNKEKNKIKSIPIPEEKNGKKFLTKIDKKLYPLELKKKYKKYLDPKFNIAKQSVINYRNVIGGTEEINIERQST